MQSEHHFVLCHLVLSFHCVAVSNELNCFLYSKKNGSLQHNTKLNALIAKIKPAEKYELIRNAFRFHKHQFTVDVQ